MIRNFFLLGDLDLLRVLCTCVHYSRPFLLGDLYLLRFFVSVLWEYFFLPVLSFDVGN